jgi:hypothetical protein
MLNQQFCLHFSFNNLRALVVEFVHLALSSSSSKSSFRCPVQQFITAGTTFFTFWSLLTYSSPSAFQGGGLSRSPPDEPATPCRKELHRLIVAVKNYELDPAGIYSDEQRAAIMGAAHKLGEDEESLLLRLATELRGVVATGSVTGVQNAAITQLAQLREAIDARVQEEGTDNVRGPGPGVTADEQQAEVPASTRPPDSQADCRCSLTTPDRC